MKHPDTWQQLIKSSSLRSVAPFRSLRPGGGETFQFQDDDHAQFLAVHTDLPYGALTERAFDDAEGLNLLPASRRTKDFVEFEVPDGLMPIVALTLGSGKRESKLLKPVYRQIGQAVRKLADYTNGAAPLIRVTDIAYNRDSHRVTFIPPVIFGESGHKLDEYEGVLNRSVAQKFSGFWVESTMHEMTAEITEGMRDESPTR